MRAAEPSWFHRGGRIVQTRRASATLKENWLRRLAVSENRRSTALALAGSVSTRRIAIPEPRVHSLPAGTVSHHYCSIKSSTALCVRPAILGESKLSSLRIEP